MCGLGRTTSVYFAYCNALQVFQGRWHPEMSWTVLRLARIANLQQVELRCWMYSWYGETVVCSHVNLRLSFAVRAWSHCIVWLHVTVATGLGTHKEKKVWVDIHVQAAGSQICLHNMCGQQRNSPMADPIFGSKYGPQNGVQNWITFSFLLLGLCLGPVLGSRFGPKSGVSHRRILLLPAEVLQADLRRTSMSVSVNTWFFSLCVPLCFLYSRGPFLAAMFLLVFWILFWEPWWSRFVGIRGAPRLTEACPRHAW